MMTRLLLFLTTLTCGALCQELPVTCLAGARFQVSDLTKARDFYTKVFGFQEKIGAGPDVVAFQINSEQFLEFSAGEGKEPLQALVFGGTDKPGAALKDPDGHRVEFAQIPRGERSAKAGGTSVSSHLLHVGMGTADLSPSGAFYGAPFGAKEIFRRPDNHLVILRLPGPREDWVELILRDEQGSQDHICLDVPDIQKTYKTLVERGATIRGKPRIASNGHWVINMADSNGFRVELMEPQAAAR